jgi:hypothetical protein
MLGQNSRMSFSHQNKKVYINIRPEKNGFWFYLQTAFNYTQSMSYFTNTCHNTFTLHVPTLITVEFLLFIKTQYTINAQNIVHLIWYTYVKSLARPTSLCRRMEMIMSLERRVCPCAELQVFSCYKGWKEACQATREFGRCNLFPSWLG